MDFHSSLSLLREPTAGTAPSAVRRLCELIPHVYFGVFGKHGACIGLNKMLT